MAIDEGPALLDRSRPIAGAGLDDIEEEPAKARDVRRFAAEEVGRVLTGQPPLSPVNAAELGDARWVGARA